MTQPIGQRFSLTYLDRGQPTPDSLRFRHRVAGYSDERLQELIGLDLSKLITRELGVSGQRVRPNRASAPERIASLRARLEVVIRVIA